jgi:hypothetical protein
VLAVSVVPERRRDDGAAQHARHFRDGDRDQAWLQAGASVAVQGGGDGQVSAGEQAQGAPAVPGFPSDYLPEQVRQQDTRLVIRALFENVLPTSGGSYIRQPPGHLAGSYPIIGVSRPLPGLDCPALVKTLRLDAA